MDAQDSDAARAAALGQVGAALATLELAAIRHRHALRRTLQAGDEELSALLHLARQGPAEQRELAALSGLSRSGAGAMLQRLEERGQVRRWTDRDDRRLRLAELTPVGRTALAQASSAWETAVAAALETSSVDAIERMAAVLTEIATIAEPSLVEPEADPDVESGDPIWRHWG